MSGIQHGHLHKIDPKDLLSIQKVLKGGVSQLQKAVKGGRVQHDLSGKTLKGFRSGTRLKHTIDKDSVKKSLGELEGFLGRQKTEAAKALAVGSLIAGGGAAAGSRLVNKALGEKKAFWVGFEKSARELTSKARGNLPKSSFVFPEKRKYSIHDETHARNALARVAQFGSPSEQKAVRAAVHSNFPGIGD